MKFVLKLIIPACLALLTEAEKATAETNDASSISDSDNAAVLLALKSCIVDTCVAEYRSEECLACKQDVTARCHSVCKPNPGDGLQKKFRKCKKRCHQASKDSNSPIEAMKNVKAVTTLSDSDSKSSTKKKPKQPSHEQKKERRKRRYQERMAAREAARKAQRSANNKKTTKKTRKQNRAQGTLTKVGDVAASEKKEFHQCIRQDCFQFLSEECQTCKNSCKDVTPKKACYENLDCHDTCHQDDALHLQFRKCKAKCKGNSAEEKFANIDIAKAHQCFSDTCYGQYLTGNCATCKNNCYTQNFPQGEEQEETSFADKLTAMEAVHACKVENKCRWKDCQVVGGKTERKGFRKCRQTCMENAAIPDSTSDD